MQSSLIVGLSDGTIQVYNREWKPTLTLRAHNREVSDIICLENSFITASWDKTVKEWLYNGQLIRTFIGHEDAVISLDIDESNKLLVSGSEDGTAKIWNLSDYAKTLKKEHLFRISTLNYSKDGSKFISGAWENTFKIWDAKNGNVIAAKKHCQGCIIRVAKFHEKGYITGGGDGHIRIWDASLKQKKYYRLGKSVYDLEVSTKGDFIIGAGGDADIGIAKSGIQKQGLLLI